MDFNVSSIKNKSSQNKINTCMNSVKKIIYDYVPFESKPLEYNFWTYKGKVNKDTKIKIDGKSPAFANEVLGTIGQYTVHCGTIKPDGFFYGRNILINNDKGNLKKTTTSWNYPGTNEYTTEVKVGVKDLQTLTIPGVRPMIFGANYFGELEILYKSDDPEKPLDPKEIIFKASATDGTITEEVTVSVGECNEYKEGICLGVLYTIINEKIQNYKLLNINPDAKEAGFTFVVYINEETALKKVRVYKSKIVDLLFNASDVDKDVTGKNPEVYKYSKVIEEKTDEQGLKNIVTTTVQPQLNITEVIKSGDKWKTKEHFQVVTTVLTEIKNTTVQDAPVNIAILYEINKEEK